MYLTPEPYFKSMRVLLTNPPCRFPLGEGGLERYVVRGGIRWPFSIIKERERKLPAMLPFYQAYSAALLEKEGIEVKVIDAIPLNLEYDEFYRLVKKRSPDLAVVECSTISIDNDLKVAEKIKEETGAKIMLAGLHVSALPNEIMNSAPWIDYIAIGEYEYTILESAQRLEKGKDNMEGVKGLAWREGGGRNKIKINPRRELIEPLDKLPYPARHLFPLDNAPDMDVYFDEWCQRRPALQQHASRGCPYGCNFCAWTQVIYASRKYRTFSPGYVVGEMQHLIQRWNAKEIYFDDDDFTIDKMHVLEICKLIRENGIEIPWSCMGDVISVDEELIREMANAGCFGLKFGVESGDEALIRANGKPVSLAKVKQVAKWCRKYKLRTHATFTFGLLGESKESVKKTINFALSLDVDSVQFSITTPFPGTKFYEEAKPYIIAQRWEEFDGCHRAVVSYPQLSAKEIERAFKEASLAYKRKKLLNPRWLFGKVKLHYKTGGIKALCNGMIKATKLFVGME